MIVFKRAYSKELRQRLRFILPHEKSLIKKTPDHFLNTGSSFFRLKAADRRGYIKILLLKNISHLRERSHKFNPNYYVEFSKIF